MDFKDFIIWEATTRDTIDFKKIYVDISGGDVVCGLALSEIIYWYLPTRKGNESKLRVFRNDEYWLAIQWNEWYSRARLTRRQAQYAIDKLIKRGLIEKKLYKFNNVPTVHLRLLEDKFLELWNEVSGQQMNPIAQNCAMDCTKLGNPLTETTTEDTKYIAGNQKMDEHEPNDIEKFFMDKAAQQRKNSNNPPVPKSADEYRQRIAKAMGAYFENNSNEDKEIVNYLTKIPENVREIADAFCRAWRIPITKVEDRYWRKAWNEQSQLGLNKLHIKLAIEKMIREGLVIKSPASVTAVAESIKASEKKGSNAKTNITEVWYGDERIR